MQLGIPLRIGLVPVLAFALGACRARLPVPDTEGMATPAATTGRSPVRGEVRTTGGYVVPAPVQRRAVAPAEVRSGRAPARGPRPVAGRNFDPMVTKDPYKHYLNAYWGLAPSFLPNVGVALEAGAVSERGPRFIKSYEMKVTWQFLDDEAFADDGGPSAGNWFQAQGGLKLATAPLARRHWVFRGGLVWFYAGGVPNIVQEEGHYLGGYASAGFEAEIRPNFSTGPELALLLVGGQGRAFLIPQFNWHFIWSF